jgi:hypothetical protein
MVSAPELRAQQLTLTCRFTRGPLAGRVQSFQGIPGV